MSALICTQFQTPRWCCQMMADMIPSDCITVLEPTAGVGNLARAVRDRKFLVTAPNDFWADIGDNERFDCVVMNPPFSPMKRGYEILDKCMGMSDRIIALMPWLVLINSERRTRKIIDFGLRSVTHLPRKTFKGARVQCLVLNLERGHANSHSLEFANIPRTPK